MTEVPIIIDFEASGFGSTSYPIEVGVALDNGDRYSRLIKPVPNWRHWDDAAESVHGISRNLLETFGQTPRVVGESLNALLAGKTVYCDGWAVDFPWLRTLFWAAQLEATFHLSPLEAILSEAQMAIWRSVKQRIESDLDAERHRASVDAQIIQMTYVQTRNETTKA